VSASDWIDDMIERAVKRERERCAKIAEQQAHDCMEQYKAKSQPAGDSEERSCWLWSHDTAKEIATAIRNLKD